MTEKRTPPYVHARQQLSRYATRERFPDGWLPPERVLCQELGVSRGTLRKALAQLVGDGYVAKVPPKGNYITGAPRRLNIGIFLGNSALSDATVSAPHLLSGVLEVLGDSGCVPRMLNCRGAAQVEEACRQQELDGLVWCCPPPAAFPAIEGIIASGGTPLVAPMFYGMFPSRNYVAWDAVRMGRFRAEYFLSRGHSQIAYLGDAAEQDTYRTFVAVLAEAGIDYDQGLHVPEVEAIAEVLPRLLRQGRITAVVSNGGPDRLENLFRAVESQPPRQPLDLLLDHVSALPDIMARHPGVPVAAVSHLPQREVGTTAAAALLRMLDGKWDGQPILLMPTRVQCLDGARREPAAPGLDWKMEMKGKG